MLLSGNHCMQRHVELTHINPCHAPSLQSVDLDAWLHLLSIARLESFEVAPNASKQTGVQELFYAPLHRSDARRRNWQPGWPKDLVCFRQALDFLRNTCSATCCKKGLRCHASHRDNLFVSCTHLKMPALCCIHSCFCNTVLSTLVKLMHRLDVLSNAVCQGSWKSDVR